MHNSIEKIVSILYHVTDTVVISGVLTRKLKFFVMFSTVYQYKYLQSYCRCHDLVTMKNWLLKLLLLWTEMFISIVEKTYFNDYPWNRLFKSKSNSLRVINK